MTQFGCLIIDVQGASLSADEREKLCHPLIGGVILFARNYESRNQLADLIQQIRQARKTPLLIMVDQEGGRVQRFVKEFTRLPAMAMFGKLYETEPDKALALAHDTAWLMATELLSLGVDLSLAPVLDLNCGISSVIGERAFHYNPQVVTELAIEFVKGMNDAGMVATAKHFPGHGSVSKDSHVEIPVDDRQLADIINQDLVPFQNLIKAKLSAVMAAHIVFPQIDSYPVSYSAVWLKEILRKQYNFQGIIISDDLNMEGANISNHFPDRVISAKEAGCDLVLVCNNPQAVDQVLDNVSYLTYSIDEEKWRKLAGKQTKINYQKDPRWQATVLALETANMSLNN